MLGVACSGTDGAEPGGQAPPAATDITTAQDYTRLVIEVDAVQGHAPRQEALDSLQAALEDLRDSGHLGKPDGVQIRIDQTDLTAAPQANHAYSLDELKTLAAGARSYEQQPNEVVLHMLYVDGESAQADSTLGFALGSTLIVMFREVIDSTCTAALPAVRNAVCRVAEASVLLHEVGHTMGLVNNGIPMVEAHQDTAHGAHDSDSSCIMFWAAERTSAIDLIIDRVRNGDTSIGSFDAKCLEDLKAAQTP